MSDQNAALLASLPAALLDLDLNQVDTSFPVVKGGIYDMVIKDCGVADTKAGDAKNFVFKLATTIQTEGVKGEKFEPGHIITSQISLKTVSDKKTPVQMAEIVFKNVSRFVQAIRPTVSGITVRDIFDGSFEVKCKGYQGRQVRVKLDALPERRDQQTQKTLPPSNDIAQFIKV